MIFRLPSHDTCIEFYKKKLITISTEPFTRYWQYIRQLDLCMTNVNEVWWWQTFFTVSNPFVYHTFSNFSPLRLHYKMSSCHETRTFASFLCLKFSFLSTVKSIFVECVLSSKVIKVLSIVQMNANAGHIGACTLWGTTSAPNPGEKDFTS